MSVVLSAQANEAADIIWAHRSIEYPADKLVKALGVPRHQAVWVLKELEEAGHGRFVVGRRGQTSRFVREAVRPAPAMAERVDDEEVEPAKKAFREQSLDLMRAIPMKITVPGDLTKDEAEMISKWLSVIAR